MKQVEGEYQKTWGPTAVGKISASSGRQSDGAGSADRRAHASRWGTSLAMMAAGIATALAVTSMRARSP